MVYTRIGIVLTFVGTLVVGLGEVLRVALKASLLYPYGGTWYARQWGEIQRRMYDREKKRREKTEKKYGQELPDFRLYRKARHRLYFLVSGLVLIYAGFIFLLLGSFATKQ